MLKYPSLSKSNLFINNMFFFHILFNLFYTKFFLKLKSIQVFLKDLGLPMLIKRKLSTTKVSAVKIC